MDDTSDDEKSDRTDNSFMKNDTSDCKEQESQRSLGFTIQPLKKASLVLVLLKRIQPSLSEREWIINQRQNRVCPEKLKIYATGGIEDYGNDKRQRRKERRDISESRTTKSRKVNCLDKSNENKQKMDKKWEEMLEKKRKLAKKSKREQDKIWSEKPKKRIKEKIYDSRYKKDDRRSIHSFDSEICLADLTLNE